MPIRKRQCVQIHNYWSTGRNHDSTIVDEAYPFDSAKCFSIKAFFFKYLFVNSNAVSSGSPIITKSILGCAKLSSGFVDGCSPINVVLMSSSILFTAEAASKAMSHQPLKGTIIITRSGFHCLMCSERCFSRYALSQVPQRHMLCQVSEMQRVFPKV